MPLSHVKTTPDNDDVDVPCKELGTQLKVNCGVTVTLKLGILDCTVQVVLQPELKFVAVNVKTPDAVDVPGLLTGEAKGSVGASQPNAIPAVEVAFNPIVPELHAIEKVATGPSVFDVIVTGTVAVHKLKVFVRTTEQFPAVVAIKLDVDVLVQTAVVFGPVKALTVIVLIKQDKLAVVGVTV